MSTPTTFGLSTMIPDLLARYPQARPVLDRYGLHGCGGPTGPVETLGFFARTHGVGEERLMAELRAAVSDPVAPAAAPHEERVEDTIYRRFFVAGIVSILTAGATWGAYILWKIGFAGNFTGSAGAPTIHEVNAHGHAQIFGWVGLFVMGFAYQAFPRLWHTRLWRPGLAIVAFVAMIAGLVLRTVGMTLTGHGACALHLAMAGGALEIAAAALFAQQIVITFLRSGARLEPYVGFVIAGLAFFVIQAFMCVWHTWRTMTAATREDLLWQVATWQAPLRDVQIHGLALILILGVCTRMLPALFNVPKVPERRAWRALGLLVSAVVLEVGIFATYRFTGVHWIAAFLMIPWVMMTVGAWMVAGPWKLWRGLRGGDGTADRVAKFIVAAYAWLAVSLVMLLLLPVHHALTRIPFSHAYYGAIRHAITVGFVSLMIMGFAAKVVPTLNGLDPRKLPALWGPFVLINVGCFLRVFLQSMTDAHPAFFKLVGISGVLEVTALAWWGLGLVRIMRRGKREARAWARSEGAAAGTRPDRVRADHKVADVVEWWPATEDVFANFGFDAIRNRLMRRTVARAVSVEQAAGMKGVDLAKLMAALNEVAAAGVETCGSAGAGPAEAPVRLRVLAGARSE